MTRRQMVGLTLVFFAMLTAGTFAGAATTPDNSNICPAYGKTAKGVEKRPCRPGSTHKISIGVGGKYTPAVGVQSRCLTPDQETQYVKDRGASCTVEYCTPVGDGKEKCTKKTVTIDLSKPDPYGGVSSFSQQAQADSTRLAAYTAMSDTVAAYKAGDMAKVQEIANQTKANPEVSALINSAFSNIKSPTAGGGAAGTLSDEAKLQAVIASLDPQKSGTTQSPKDVVTPKSDTIAVDVTVEKAPKDIANMPCPAGAPCDTQGKTATPASTFSPSPATEANKKTTAQPVQPTSWWGSVTNKVSDYLPASVNRWLGLANTPDFRPYDPATDVPLLVKENDSDSLKDKLHLDPFDTQSPVVLMNKDVSVSSSETALQAMTKRQSQAVQTADFDPSTPVPSGGIVVTPLGADGKPDLAASQVMEVGTWRDFLNEVKGNDKYNNTVISVNIPESEKKTEPSAAGIQTETIASGDLPASVRKQFEELDRNMQNKVPVETPGVPTPPAAGGQPNPASQNTSAQQSVPLSPVPPMEQSQTQEKTTQPPASLLQQPNTPPVPNPLPQPTPLTPTLPQEASSAQPSPQEPQKVEEQKIETTPAQPPIPVLSSPAKSEDQVPAPSQENNTELSEQLPAPAVQPTTDAFENCNGDVYCRDAVLRAMLKELKVDVPREPQKTEEQKPEEKPAQPPVSVLAPPSEMPVPDPLPKPEIQESNDQSNNQSTSQVEPTSSFKLPEKRFGETSDNYMKRVDAYFAETNARDLEKYINSLGGRPGDCASCHSPGSGLGPVGTRSKVREDYGGIGIRVMLERRDFGGQQLPGGTVTSVFYPGTPAAQAGLHSGDFILKVDGGTGSIISGIGGKSGTNVSITYIPQGSTVPKTVTIKRATIQCSIYGCP